MAKTKPTARKTCGGRIPAGSQTPVPQTTQGTSSRSGYYSVHEEDKAAQTVVSQLFPQDLISGLLALKDQLVKSVRTINTVVNIVRGNQVSPFAPTCGVATTADSSVVEEHFVPDPQELRYSSPTHVAYSPPETSVPHPTSQRAPHGGLIGRGSPTGSIKSTPRGRKERVRELFITRVSRDTSGKELLDFVSIRVRPISFQRISHPEAYHQSFLLSVSDSDVSRIMQPDIWPIGIECRPFRRPSLGWLARGESGHRQPPDVYIVPTPRVES